MIVLLAVVLLVNAVFAAFVWPPFYRRVAADPRARDESGRATPFLRVHTILIAAALVLAAVSAVVAIVALVSLA